MVSLSWEECGCILKQLQFAAHIVHSSLGQAFGSDSKRVLRALLSEIISCVQEFRHTINELFLESKHVTTNQQELCSSGVPDEQLKKIKEVLATIQICTRCNIPTIETIQQDRFQKTEDELASVAQLDDVWSRHDLPGTKYADKERLKALITRLRQQEQELPFHQGLLKAQQQLSGPDSDYTADNFAYGSTPFPTWLNLFTQKPVLDAIARAQKKTLTVFGSSSGSLVFFAALALNLRSMGIEILPFLHDVAKQTREELQISKDKCHFICADMLTVPVQDTSLLLLTSQCWDAELYNQVQHKLEAELQPGALVIDYKDTLQNSTHFRLLHQLSHQVVSWNNSHSFFIFAKI